MRKHWKFTAIAFSLIVVPCFADIVPISISEEVSGAGEVDIVSPEPIPLNGVSGNFSFDDSNHESGSYTVVKSGSVYLDGSPVQGPNVTFEAEDEQILDLTSESISLDTVALCDFQGGILHGLGTCDARSLFDLQFSLTNPSILHLTVLDSPDADADFNGSSLFDGGVLLDGPGINFDSNYDFFDQFFLLDPGIYNLSAVAGSSFVAQSSSSFAFFSHSITVNADVTSVTSVPEPRWAFLAVPILLVVWRGRHPASTSRN